MVRTISILLIFLISTSCGIATTVGAVAGNASTSTRGITGTFSDNYLLSRVKAKVSSLKLKNFTNVTVSVSHGKVLLAGYVDNQLERLEIIKNVWEINGVKEIFNEIEVGRSISVIDAAEDMVFETKVENRILFEEGIFSNNYSVDVVDGNVYVMGIASSIEEKNKLERFLRSMNDIKRLIFLVDIPRSNEEITK